MNGREFVRASLRHDWEFASHSPPTKPVRFTKAEGSSWVLGFRCWPCARSHYDDKTVTQPHEAPTQPHLASSLTTNLQPSVGSHDRRNSSSTALLELDHYMM